MPASMSSAFMVGRGMFPGWAPRCAVRPVRPAPLNCIVPRRRPPVAPFMKALYFAVLVVLGPESIAAHIVAPVLAFQPLVCAARLLGTLVWEHREELL